MPSPKRELPEQWQKLMYPKGIRSMRKLGEKTGLQHTTIRGVIHGSTHAPTPDTLQRIADALDIKDVTYIYKLAGVPADRLRLVAWEAPEESAWLTPPQRRALEATIRSMVEVNKQLILKDTDEAEES